LIMGRQLLLEKISVPGIQTLEAYRREGGYSVLESALKKKPEEITEEVKKSGLREEAEQDFQQE